MNPISRQIVLDTETTGIGHELGHRIIEIGCIELVDRRATGEHFHCYLNPQRPVDIGAFKVHGLSSEFLADKPLFKDCLLYTSPSPRDRTRSRMPSSA